MSKSRIGLQNLLELGAVVVSSENPDYPVANCFDGNTYDFFKPASGGGANIDLTLSEAAPADFLAFYGQNLYKHGGSIKLQYDGGAGFVDASATITPTGPEPVFVFFPSQTAEEWRVVISCSEVFSLGVLMFGAHLALERPMYIGWTPPRFASEDTMIDSMSENGQFLGRSRISQAIRTSINFNNASDAWMDANWPGFADRAASMPFFFAADVVNYPDDCVLCWSDGPIGKPQHVHFGYMSASVAIRGLIK